MIKLPEKDELVLITVKKIMPYGAFCELDEYGKHEAFVHISEVAPRWIKNIHEFLHEGQKLVAKVHHIELEKNQIDLSLKRVNDSERKLKLETSRKEKRAEKLFEVAQKIAKSTKSEAFDARTALEDKYDSLIDAIEEIAEKGSLAIANLKMEKGLAKAILEVTSKSIRKQKAEVNGILKLTSYAPNGVEVVKKILSQKPKVEGEFHLLYLGAPKYQIKVIADNFKKAEKTMETLVEYYTNAAKESKSKAEYSKIET